MEGRYAKARDALIEYLTERPGARPGDVLGHFFPEPNHGFDKSHLSATFVEMMHSGEIEADAQWSMTLTTSSATDTQSTERS